MCDFTLMTGKYLVVVELNLGLNYKHIFQVTQENQEKSQLVKPALQQRCEVGTFLTWWRL
jgi:hypothetical protein